MPALDTLSAYDTRSRQLSLFGVPITDVTMDEAIRMIESLMKSSERCHPVYFANSHTLNLAILDPEFRDVLCQARWVFGDGTGVRWAARILHGARLKDNLNGTDLVPALFAATGASGYRYFLLGASPDAIGRAAEYARKTFVGWQQVGYHHGYLDGADTPKLVTRINESGADMLLVGMGNPLQERWIHAQRRTLRVPLCMGVGGLFSYWSGDLERAPLRMRQLGQEWIHLAIKQPRKLRRYLAGNPQFLWRVGRSWLTRDRRLR